MALLKRMDRAVVKIPEAGASGTVASRRMTMIGSLSDRRNNNFNLIRMVAASLVLVSHAFSLSYGKGIEPLADILYGLSLGRVAVIVFFAVSGFFITRSFCRKPSLALFLSARMLRLFPALAVMLVVMASAGAVLTDSPAAYRAALPGFLADQITLSFGDIAAGRPLDRVLPGLFATNPYPGEVNGSLWTLPFEVLCYLAVTLVGLAGLLHGPRRFLPVMLLFLAGYVAIQLKPFNWYLLTFFTLGLPFLIGAAFWIWRDRIPLSPWLTLIFGILALLAWPLPQLAPAGLERAAAGLLFMPPFCLALAHAAFVLGQVRLPGLGAYSRLGDYSYGMYIYAFPVQQLMASWGATTPLANMLTALPLTLVLAVLSWRLIERPALDLQGRMIRARARDIVAGPSALR